jgi:Icc protein
MHRLSGKIHQISPLTIAQVTDIHLFHKENHKLLGMQTLDSFYTAIERLKELRNEIDLLLLTGDLSSDGSAESYEYLQNLLKSLNIPTYWLPGNHDKPDVMGSVLGLGLISKRKSFIRGGWHFILLDSSVAECVHGYLNSQTLNWLDSELTQVANLPTVVALHHPPFLVNSQWLDRSNLQNPDALFTVLDRHPQVHLVLSGHIHQEFHYQRQNVDYLGTPSTCIQFEPESQEFAIDHNFPGFRLFKLYPDGNWNSWVERVSYTTNCLDFAAAGY